MDVTLPAFSRCEIEFKIGVGASRCPDMIERNRSQRRASEIRVQDHTGGIDERQQRITQRLAELTFDRCRQPSKRKLQRFFVQLPACNLPAANLPAKARQHDPNTFGNGGMPLAFDQRLHVRLAEKFVSRRQFLK